MFKHIEQITQLAEQNKNLSDIHMAGGKCVSVRINGDIQKLTDKGVIDESSMKDIVMQLLDHDEKRYHDYLEHKEYDFSYVSSSSIPFRVNAYFSMGQMCVVMRKINRYARKLEDMMFSDIAEAIKEQILPKQK